MPHILEYREGPSDLITYWNEEFRRDVKLVQEALPPAADMHDTYTTLQPFRLGPRNPLIRQWSRRAHGWQLERFAIALYLMLRLDGFVATRHANLHGAFARKFAAPKLIGDCPGGCFLHLKPEDVLFCLGRGAARWQDRIPIIPGPGHDVQALEIACQVKNELLPLQSMEHFRSVFREAWTPGILLAAEANRKARAERANERCRRAQRDPGRAPQRVMDLEADAKERT